MIRNFKYWHLCQVSAPSCHGSMGVICRMRIKLIFGETATFTGAFPPTFRALIDVKYHVHAARHANIGQMIDLADKRFSKATQENG